MTCPIDDTSVFVGAGCSSAEDPCDNGNWCVVCPPVFATKAELVAAIGSGCTADLTASGPNGKVVKWASSWEVL